MTGKVCLDDFDNRWYNPGKNSLVRGMWFIISGVFFLNPFFTFYGFKRWLLRMFGAKIGRGVVVKPRVYIKYPWRLEVGDFSWIGEEVRIDNLADVKVGSNVCISQRSYLVCGNHDYTSSSFDLMVQEIQIEDGVWIGAGSTVCPGSFIREHTVLMAGSVFSGTSEPYFIYSGNPAVKVKERVITTSPKS